MKKILFLVCVITISSPLFSQTLPEKIDSFLNASAHQNLFNGTALIARKGTILLQKGYGYKDEATKSSNDPNTLFQIGSVTKQFTSAIILQLQEKNRLSVQDKLSKYIPDYPHGDQITIENLLTHTSGIYNYTNDKSLMSRDMTKPVSRDSLVASFKNKPLDFYPGEKYNYSNSNYILLGIIIEKVTGKSYFRVVRENIFQPLQMSHSGFDFAGLNNADKATGYFTASAPAPVLDSSISFAAGSLYTTVGDLYKWDRALYTGRILRPASLEKAFTPFKAKYGYGWSLDSAYGKKIVEHGGAIPGFMSFILRVPEEETCIILLDNHSSPSLAKLANDLNTLLNGKEITQPKGRTEINLDPETLQQYAGEYELVPGFVITVSLQNGKLMAQATGQGAAEIFAEKKDFFFYKIVDAQIEFVRGAGDKVEKLILHQNGRDLPGKKTR